MASDFQWKRHDLGPAIFAQLFDETGAPYILTGKTVTFIMTIGQSGTPTVDATATVSDAVNGIVSYTPIAADTALAGDFNVEWQVSAAGSPATKITFPNFGNQTLHIDADLDNA